jgi:hypothetical protein
MVLVNTGFPQAKEFVQKNIRHLGTRPTNVRQPCSRPKKFKENPFEGEPN